MSWYLLVYILQYSYWSIATKFHCQVGEYCPHIVKLSSWLKVYSPTSLWDEALWFAQSKRTILLLSKTFDTVLIICVQYIQMQLKVQSNGWYVQFVIFTMILQYKWLCDPSKISYLAKMQAKIWLLGCVSIWNTYLDPRRSFLTNYEQ